MKRIILSLAFFSFALIICAKPLRVENKFAEPLGQVLNEISQRFGATLLIKADTTGKVVDYAYSRIRPYSLEESLENVLAPFDYFAKKQRGDKVYKIKKYEYATRKDEEGKALTEYLSSLYSDKKSWEIRRTELKKQFRDILGIDTLLSQTVKNPDIKMSKKRKYNGYTVRNFALETLPGLYVCGSIYEPRKYGKHPLIICPNGHFGGGRYNRDQQVRLATMARMGAICVDYDLFGWGESEYQVGMPSHRTSAAMVIQVMNGEKVLDFMLKKYRRKINKKKIGVNGGSGGGTHTCFLSVLDDRFAASAPVVSVSSHFDGGCPCESGIPVSTACGGTCNIEYAATFAPKPQLIVSDGGDWTSTTPEIEYPFIKRIYGFYEAGDKVKNVHLPKEHHDFGINKRKAVYSFFINVFGLDGSKIDESKVVIEEPDAMKSFGKEGELMPKAAVRSFNALSKYFSKNLYRETHSDEKLLNRAKSWTAALNLKKQDQISFVTTTIFNYLKKIRDWHNSHPYTMIPEGINPRTGGKLTKLDRQMIMDSSQPSEFLDKFKKDLRRVITDEQIENVIFDKYTVGKVGFTMKGYEVIVLDLTDTERAFIMKELKQARREAVIYKNMNEISAIFEIHKTNCENYFNTHGRNWHQIYSDFYKRIKAQKAAAKKKR